MLKNIMSGCINCSPHENGVSHLSKGYNMATVMPVSVAACRKACFFSPESNRNKSKIAMGEKNTNKTPERNALPILLEGL